MEENLKGFSLKNLTKNIGKFGTKISTSINEYEKEAPNRQKRKIKELEYKIKVKQLENKLSSYNKKNEVECNAQNNNYW